MQEWSRHTGIPWIDWAGWGNRGLAAPSLGSSPHIQSYQLAKMAEVTDSCNLGSTPAHRHPCCASELTLLAHVFHLLPPPKCPTKEMLHPQGIRLAWLLIFTFKFPFREKRNLTRSHLPAWVICRKQSYVLRQSSSLKISSPSSKECAQHSASTMHTPASSFM